MAVLDKYIKPQRMFAVRRAKNWEIVDVLVGECSCDL